MARRLAFSFAVLLLALVMTRASRSAAAEDGWTDLFDGKTLDGWKQLGGDAKYAVEDGAIVGTSVPNTSNSFLCTEKTFGDFILELDFKVHPELNSGVQIRSQSAQSAPDNNKSRVFGYQVEIDASDRAWSGGIYDEGRRGWLNSLEYNAPARAAFKPNDWNHFRIQCIGDSLKTWLNGVPAADLVDALTPTGVIGLQVHGVGGRQDPIGVRWRNIRIKDLGVSHWKPLFDGQSLAGWTPLPGGHWAVEEGVIHGTSAASDPRHGILLSNEKFRNFTIHLVYRAKRGNSGFYFRCDKVDGPVSVHGFQAEIDPTNDAGGLYETGGRAWVVQPAPELVKRCFKPGQWNEMTVSAHGRRLTVSVNGTKTAELKQDPGRLEGYLGLQLHGGQDMDVEYKTIEQLISPNPHPLDAPAAATADSPVVPPGVQVKKVADGFKFTLEFLRPTASAAVGPSGPKLDKELSRRGRDRRQIGDGEL